MCASRSGDFGRYVIFALKLNVAKMTKGGYRVIKGIGVGFPGQKNDFGFFRSKFCVLSPPFYRNEKLPFVCSKMGHLWRLVGDIWGLNLHVFMEFGQ